MNRRDFLSRTGKWMALGLIVPPYARRVLAAQGAAGSSSGAFAALPGKILIGINLGGGNDGLNMVPPIGDGLYTAGRQNIAITNPIPLDATTGLHPSLLPLEQFFTDGELAVIQGLSYPEPNLSHFRATDIWFSGSSATEEINTGWLARYMEAIHPEFPGTLPDAPYILQQGLSQEIPITGDRGNVGVSVADPSTFFNLVGAQYTGQWSDLLPATRGGQELDYVRTVDVESFEYAAAIQAAAEAGTNTTTYPNTPLGQQLEIVAKLISGQLDTGVYLTSYQGFDTHTNQLGAHANLLDSLAQSVAALFADLKSQGLADRVVVMTTSEFGRRPFENGGFGTDHGTAAPHFVLGPSVTGGIYGTSPDLANLDPNGNLLMQFDYRSLYASILQGHFDATSTQSTQILFGGFPTLGLFGEQATQPTDSAPASTAVAGAALVPQRNALHASKPNPFSTRRSGPVEMRFDLATPGRVSLRVYSVDGRLIERVVHGDRPAGQHRVLWSPRGIAPGMYFYRLEAPGWQESRKLIVLP